MKVTSRELQRQHHLSRSETVTFSEREFKDTDAFGQALHNHRNECNKRVAAHQPIRPVKTQPVKKL